MKCGNCRPLSYSGQVSWFREKTVKDRLALSIFSPFSTDYWGRLSFGGTV